MLIKNKGTRLFHHTSHSLKLDKLLPGPRVYSCRYFEVLGSLVSQQNILTGEPHRNGSAHYGVLEDLPISSQLPSCVSLSSCGTLSETLGSVPVAAGIIINIVAKSLYLLHTASTCGEAAFSFPFSLRWLFGVSK